MVYVYYHCDDHISNNQDEYDFCTSDLKVIGHAIEYNYVTYIKCCRCYSKSNSYDIYYREKSKNIKNKLFDMNKFLLPHISDYYEDDYLFLTVYNHYYEKKYIRFLFQNTSTDSDIEICMINKYSEKISSEEFLSRVNSGSIIDICTRGWTIFLDRAKEKEEEDKLTEYVAQLLSKTGFFLRKNKSPWDNPNLYTVDKYAQTKKAICK